MSKTKVRVIADENINGLECFERIADLTRVSGRTISAEHIKNADALLIRSVSKIHQNLLHNSPVRFIASATSGIDHVDVDYLQKNNIHFSYAPGSNANSVIQYVFAGLAFLSEKYTFDWRALSFGIVGAGNVGGLLARYFDKLKIRFSIYDPFLPEGHPYSDRFVPFDEVLQQDVITLHTPLTTTGTYPTHHLLDRKALQTLNKNTILINAARGAVIDNQALYEALDKHTWKCVLDVWENEPDIFLPLLEKVDIGTTHIAGYSFEGKEQGSAIIYKDFVNFFELDDAQAFPVNKETKLLDVSFRESELEQINQAILSAYAIQNDYAQMLEIKKDNSASGFDALRKNYPLRHEFQHYRLDYSAFSENAGKVLRTLGFNRL
jgi:erythronate-4-phosphate dehydrogenase